ncbi:MAG TPA: glucosamine-6-phosphate isomerase [Clostridiaceae bacterium]|nr:glucosamine-6-phosphate isomerase [Clostridiaceae bacterium]
MLNTYFCSPDEFLKNSRIPIRVKESEQEMYEEIAQIMIDTIVKKEGQRKVFICPVGPIGQYPLFVEKVNNMRISLKNVWFINMDEYLDDDNNMISSENPLSFRSTMERLVYSKIDPELLMPKEQRCFPIPGEEKKIDRLLDEIGPVDCCLTGVGINGHIAFNEPPAEDDPITDEQYMELGTRCLDLSKETIVNNGARKIYGALDIFPKRCITLGMKQILKTKKIKIYLYCDWQWGIMRKIALEPPSRFAPASFLQLHPDSEMVITRKLLETRI